jgi:[acyl-carrier-protein] S-malonyltransferase
VSLPGRGTVFMFPGQNSRYPDMIEKLVAKDTISARLVAEASDILGRDLARHYRSGNPNIFACNRDVQVGVFLANHLHMRRLEERGVQASHSLGLSLGEYNHLVHAGAIDFAEALRLVEARGTLYGEGPSGVMIAVFPIDADTVEKKIAAMGLQGRAAIGLYNTPRQQVLSGEKLAVRQLAAALEEDFTIMAVESEPNIPMHATAFRPVAEKFEAILSRASFHVPRLPYVPNVVGRAADDASPDTIRACLKAHVCEPVLWRASVESVAAAVRDPCFIEVGPSAVLYNMFGRGWTPGQRAHADDHEEGKKASQLDRLVAELGRDA